MNIGAQFDTIGDVSVEVSGIFIFVLRSEWRAMMYFELMSKYRKI